MVTNGDNMGLSGKLVYNGKPPNHVYWMRKMMMTRGIPGHPIFHMW